MRKLLAVPLTGIVLVGTVGAVIQEQEIHEEPAPAPGASPVSDAPRSVTRITVRPTAVEPVGARLGVTLGPVSEELRTHLGLPAGQGLVVTEVAPDSRAAQAGLTPYDVLLTVNQRPVMEDTLAHAIEAPRGLEFLVIRKGMPQLVAIPREGATPAGFLSSASLPANHAFRRFQAYHELRETYAEQAAQYSALLRDLDEESRRARDEAKQERATLQAQGEAQVAAVMARFQEELLARVDERLGEALVAPLQELALDLDELLLPDHLEEIEALRAQTRELLGGELVQRLNQRTEGLEDGVREHHRQRVQGIAHELQNLCGERVDSPWVQSLREVLGHEERLGRRQQERARWAAKAVEETRRHLHTRITCAVERTGLWFGKGLRARLQSMEVPAPGEAEAAIADAQDQIDTMAERFLRRTEEALDEYWSQVAAAHEKLTPAAEAGLDGGSSSFAGLGRAFQRAIETATAVDVDRDGERWQQRGQTEDIELALQTELRRAVNDGRDAVRAAAVPLATAFREHKVVTEDAWRDLEKLLSALRSQADNDCWKLDGPYLDGRFPKQPNGEPVKKKGELAALTR